MTSMTNQTLLEIAKVLDGIAYNDLTRAEQNIFKILRDANIMEMVSPSEFRVEIVKVRK